MKWPKTGTKIGYETPNMIGEFPCGWLTLSHCVATAPSTGSGLPWVFTAPTPAWAWEQAHASGLPPGSRLLALGALGRSAFHLHLPKHILKEFQPQHGEARPRASYVTRDACTSPLTLGWQARGERLCMGFQSLLHLLPQPLGAFWKLLKPSATSGAAVSGWAFPLLWRS